VPICGFMSLSKCVICQPMLQVIALVHTLLKCPAVGLKHCLVLAPLNAVLNWVYEWHKWLDKRNQLKVEQFKLPCMQCINYVINTVSG